MQDAATQIVKLLDDTGLPPLHLAALCLVMTRQELQRAACLKAPGRSKLEQVTQELNLREEGVRQIARLQFSSSDHSPLEVAQAVLGGLEYVLHEDLRSDMPSFQAVTEHLAFMRMVSQDTGSCSTSPEEERTCVADEKESPVYDA